MTDRSMSILKRRMPVEDCRPGATALRPVGIRFRASMGNVRQAGMPAMGATVAVEGFPTLVTTTDMNGKFTLADVPTGPQQLKAQLPPPAADPPQSWPVNVVAGMDVVVDFGF